MKKLLSLFAFLLLIFPLISAVQVEMETEFDRGETLMAKISGNFLEPIQKENIVFYRDGHIRIPLEYDVAKIDDSYYIYALLGDKAPNNYSLSIENTRYMQGTSISEEDIVKTFIITEEIADFSIDPGFIIADEPFTIKVQNLRDFKIKIKINENQTLFKNLQGSEGDVELFSGEIKQLEFNLGNETSFRTVELKTTNISYSIPVYVFVSQITEEEETTTETDDEEEETTTETDDEEESQEVKIVSTKNCAELNGSVCADGEQCDETPIGTRDATCCLGTCKEIKKGSAGKIVGWSMVGIILVVLIWFFKTKYKKAKKEVNLLKIAKGKD